VSFSVDCTRQKGEKISLYKPLGHMGGVDIYIPFS